jgi:signal transduction histidine kinase
MIDDTIKIKGDTQRLTQVLMNLILNAIQAMPLEKRDGYIILRAKEIKSRMAQIDIVDNGCGIPKENMEKLFTPFFTTKEKGTGLGLSIIHRLIEEHGGMIDVTSEVGTGTTFMITLPMPDSLPILKAEKIPSLLEVH